LIHHEIQKVHSFKSVFLDILHLHRNDIPTLAILYFILFLLFLQEVFAKGYILLTIIFSAFLFSHSKRNKNFVFLLFCKF